MDKKLECLRCSKPMEFIMTEKLQLGEAGWLLRGLPNLMADALEVDIYYCTECGKLEFFHTKGQLPTKVQCPDCGRTHDRDYPKCPFCKYDYRAKK